MSNTSALALGLGSGLGLWYLTKNKIVPTRTPASRSPSEATSAQRNCAVHVDAVGVSVDGTRTTVDDAIRRCQAAGGASITIAKDAPASACVALANALAAAHVPTLRNAPSEATYTKFTLRYYPEGAKGNAKQRWFLAEKPVAWTEARDRLIAAGVVDPRAAGRTFDPAGWMLSVDKRDFNELRAEPLPDPDGPWANAKGARNHPTFSTQFTLAVYAAGVFGPKRVRWFTTDEPIAWIDAAKRLGAAGLIDPEIKSPLEPGYWILTTAPQAFDPSQATPLPRARRRRRNADTSVHFMLTIYPEGSYGIRGEPSITRWFTADEHTTWEDARDRLAAAGLLDPSIRTQHKPGFWILGMGPNAMPLDGKATEPLPTPLRRRRAQKGQTRFTTDGRRILRDGAPMVLVERIDLGDESYALTPAQTDQLVKRIVHLLNRYGMK